MRSYSRCFIHFNVTSLDSRQYLAGKCTSTKTWPIVLPLHLVETPCAAITIWTVYKGEKAQINFRDFLHCFNYIGWSVFRCTLLNMSRCNSKIHFLDSSNNPELQLSPAMTRMVFLCWKQNICVFDIHNNGLFCLHNFILWTNQELFNVGNICAVRNESVWPLIYELIWIYTSNVSRTILECLCFNIDSQSLVCCATVVHRHVKRILIQLAILLTF